MPLASLVLGAMAGLIFLRDEQVAVQLVIVAIGAVAGLAVAGALGRRRNDGSGARGRGPSDPFRPNSLSGDLGRNFWRDRGYPPFSRPSSALPDKHMFDPDRLD